MGTLWITFLAFINSHDQVIYISSEELIFHMIRAADLFVKNDHERALLHEMFSPCTTRLSLLSSTLATRGSK